MPFIIGLIRKIEVRNLLVYWEFQVVGLTNLLDAAITDSLSER